MKCKCGKEGEHIPNCENGVMVSKCQKCDDKLYGLDKKEPVSKYQLPDTKTAIDYLSYLEQKFGKGRMIDYLRNCVLGADSLGVDWSEGYLDVLEDK